MEGRKKICKLMCERAHRDTDASCIYCYKHSTLSTILSTL